MFARILCRLNWWRHRWPRWQADHWSSIYWSQMNDRLSSTAADSWASRPIISVTCLGLRLRAGLDLVSALSSYNALSYAQSLWPSPALTSAVSTTDTVPADHTQRHVCTVSVRVNDSSWKFSCTPYRHLIVRLRATSAVYIQKCREVIHTVIHRVLGDGGKFNTRVVLWHSNVQSCVELQQHPTHSRSATSLITAVSSYNKNLAIANRSRVSCAHTSSRPSIITPWPWNLG